MTPLRGYEGGFAANDARCARHDDRCAVDYGATQWLIGGAAAVMAAAGRFIHLQLERAT